MKAIIEAARTAAHARIDQHAERAKAEISAMAQQAKDAITVKVGWMVRSSGQIRRYRNARKNKHES